MEPLLRDLLEIAREASSHILDVYRRPFEVSYKRPSDPVTEADRRANEHICTRLAELFPGIPVVAEESPEASWAHYRNADKVFFVDPLDGTREFVLRSDQFVVMIGLLDGDRPSHGVLLSPVTGTAWLAGPSDGALELDTEGRARRLEIRPPSSASRLRVVASRGAPSSRLERCLLRLADPIVLPVHSAGLKGVTVARGEADVYLAPESAGCRWDSCAPEAILCAAGGVYTDAQGARLDYRAARMENDTGIVAGAEGAHRAVIEQLSCLDT